MSEIKTTVSLSDFVNLEESIKPVQINFEDGKIINVTPIISSLAMDMLISFVVESSYNKNGSYSPLLREYSLVIAMITAYTDMNVEFEEEYSLYYEKINRLMFETNIFESIMDCINQKQKDFVLDAIEQEIMYRNHSNIDKVNRQLNELTNMINSVGGDLKGMMEGISEEDIANVVNAMKDGKIDEGKLVQAYTKKTAKKKTTKKKSDASPELKLTDFSDKELM